MVKVYRLLCRNTYEREMFNKASLKLGLDKAILQSMNTAQGKDLNNKQLTKKEIEDLLKKGLIILSFLRINFCFGNKSQIVIELQFLLISILF